MPGTAPTGWKTPKTSYTADDVLTPQQFERIEGNAYATELGARTIDPSQAPTGNVGTLRQFLDWLANRIKAITGTTNWHDAPPTTLTAAKSHIDAAAPHSGHETPTGAQAKVDAHANLTAAHSATSAATANRIMMRDSAGRAKVAAPSASDDIARKDTVDAKFDVVTGHKHTGAAGDGPRIPLASLATPILELVAEFEHNSTSQNFSPVAYLVESNALLGEFYIINCYLHEDSTGAGANLYYSAFEETSNDNFSYACFWRKESEPGALYCGVAMGGTGRLHVTVQIARMVLPT